MEMQGDSPDLSPLSPRTLLPGLRESHPVTTAETERPTQASPPDRAPGSPARQLQSPPAEPPRPPAPQHQGPSDGPPWSPAPQYQGPSDGPPWSPTPQLQGPPDGAGRPCGGEEQRGDEKDDRGSSIPEVVITQADERWRAVMETQPGGAEDTGRAVGAASVNTSSDQADGGDPTCSDLQSLQSDNTSLTSDATNSGKSDGEQDCQDDDLRSVTTSSVTSLFPRLQLDPVEREWIRSAAAGDAATLGLLLGQDPTLVSKKTALHWAAKQGRLEMAEMMARAGADVNVKSGYTALHLAALHGHSHIIQLLLHTYDAKANIRDYHGKTPMHYWSGSADVFSRPGSQSCGRWSRGRRAQRYPQLPSLLLSSRTRSQGLLNLEPASTPTWPPAF